MDQSPSAQAEELFLEAVDLGPAERQALLGRACAGDEALRREVEALLEAAGSASDYFENLPERLGIAGIVSGGADGRAGGARDAGEAGQQYGQYRLTRLVGSGGMGTVWRAARSDGRFEGDVAVKLLSRTAGGAAPERFALEAVISRNWRTRTLPDCWMPGWGRTISPISFSSTSMECR